MNLTFTEAEKNVAGAFQQLRDAIDLAESALSAANLLGTVPQCELLQLRLSADCLAYDTGFGQAGAAR